MATGGGGTTLAGGGTPTMGTAAPGVTDARLKNFNKALQPLRSLLCNVLHDLPGQWDAWLADARSALAAHGVTLEQQERLQETNKVLRTERSVITERSAYVRSASVPSSRG